MDCPTSDRRRVLDEQRRGHLHGGGFDEVIGLLVGGEQCLDLAAQV